MPTINEMRATADKKKNDSTSTAIPVDSLGSNPTPMQFQSREPVNRVQAMIEQNALNATAGLTAAQEKGATQETNISDLMTAIGTEGTYREKQNEEQGVDAGKKRLKELSALALSETNNLTSNILRNESNAIGTRETGNFLGAQESRMRRESAINSLGIASEAAIVQGQTEVAQAYVDKMVKAVYEPLKAEKEVALFNLNRLDKNVLEPAQQEKAKALEKKLTFESDQLDKQQKFVDSLYKNGAPLSLIKEVLKANSPEEAMSVKGVERYAMSPAEKLDMQLKGLQIQKVRQELADGSTKDLKIVPKALPNGKPDVVDELTQVIGQTKENFPNAAAAIGVLSGVQKLATESGGKFIGSAPFRFVPGIVRGKEARGERIQNTGDFSSLDLKVQQWASGAALTEEQTKKVSKMVPDKNDTDFAVRTKLNNLTKYMQSQAKSELATKGITYEPTPVDYFAEDVAPGDSEEARKTYINQLGSVFDNPGTLYQSNSYNL